MSNETWKEWLPLPFGLTDEERIVWAEEIERRRLFRSGKFKLRYHPLEDCCDIDIPFRPIPKGLSPADEWRAKRKRAKEMGEAWHEMHDAMCGDPQCPQRQVLLNT